MTETLEGEESRESAKKRRVSIVGKLCIASVVLALVAAVAVAAWGVRSYLPQKEREALQQAKTLMRATALSGNRLSEKSGVDLATSPELLIIAALAFENPAVDYLALHQSNGKVIRVNTRNSDHSVAPLNLSNLPLAMGGVRFIPFKKAAERGASSEVYISEGRLAEGNPFRGLMSTALSQEADQAGVKPISTLSTHGQDYVDMVTRWGRDERYGEVYLRQVVNLDYVRGQLWQQLRVVVLLAAFAALATIIGVAAYARRVLSPLTLLETATAKVAEGETVGEIPILRKDEIGDLTEHFNVMNSALTNYRREVLEQKGYLENKVVARTRELAESNRKAKNVMRQAVAAKRDAEEASRAKSEFLATMSHEIRTPLNGVLGMAEIMEHTALDATQREYLQIISQSSHTLLELINDILDFSKIEAGTLDFNFSDFDLRELIEEVAVAFAEPARKKNLEMVCSVPPDMNLIVNSDVTRIRQMLSILVNNAVKFTERGMVKLGVVVLEHLEDKAQLRFEVRDTGIGIREVMIEQIFLPFSQADSSATRKYGGTGLGLAIVKQVVELAGGTVSVDSKPGLGTIFTVDLWVGAKEFESGEFQQTINQMPNLKILVVDDLSVNREIVVNQLRIWGVNCHEAASGAEAMRLLRIAVDGGKDYDMVLLDYRMPEMDGLQFATALSKDPVLAGIPMIMLSSVHNLDTRESLKELDILSYLTKPVRQADLFNALVNLASGLVKKDSGEDLKADQQKNAINAKILIVEDNIVNQKVARAVFDWLGAEITIANNGEDAFTLRKKFNYDMIFMDCQMPVMDGYQASRAIRQWEQETEGAGHIAIIALTANAIEGDREKCLDAGMDDYLSKPFNADQVSQKIERWQQKFKSQPENDLVVPHDKVTREVEIENSEAENLNVEVSVSTELKATKSKAAESKIGESKIVHLKPVTLKPVNVEAEDVNPDELNAKAEKAAETTIKKLSGRVVEPEQKIKAVGKTIEATPLAVRASAVADDDLVEDLINFDLLDSYKELQSPGDPDLRVILVETYLDEAAAIIKRKVDAAGVGDVAGIADAAHALKSSSANVGAVLMSKLSKEIEADAKSGMLGDVAARVAELERVYQQTEQQYREHFGL